MSKRTLDHFFTVQKKAKTGGDASATVASAVQTGSNGGPAAAANGATSSQQAMWGSAAPRQTAAAEPLAAADTADATAAADAAAGTTTAAAVPVTAAVAAAAEVPPSEATQEATPEKLAQWHADAERRLEEAQAHVAAAQAEGRQPILADTLIEPSWRAELGPEFQKPYWRELQTFLEGEWKSQQVYPPQHMVFRAMNSCAFDKVKVVILGQDPYHNTGQAMGMSFSVPRGVPVPSSLQNIYKELATDLGCSRPSHGCLEKWATQGVLMLNACLTVRAHSANSHSKKGWESFTDKAIAKISQHRSGVVFLLWGKPAQAKAKLINEGRHHVLKSAHPSGLSASRGFFGSKPFSKANRLLAKGGMAAIDWQIE